MSKNEQTKVAIGGLGAIGLAVAKTIDSGDIPGMVLSAVASGSAEKAAKNLENFNSIPVIVPVENLAEHADIVIECAPKSVFYAMAKSSLEQGRVFMPLSVGALLENMELLDIAQQSGGIIYVPTGALLGLDAVKAVSEGQVNSITLLTRKPPSGLRGAPYLLDNNISVDDLKEAKQVFAGTAREAAKAFPANVNVAAALALAGIGADRTTVEVWADPNVNRNMHTIDVDAEASSFSMTIQNVPSETPATGKVTALSVIAALRRFTSPLIVGT